MSDKISEIRERHSRDDRWRNTLPQMHDDRAILLAEVDRLTHERNEARAEIGQLRAENEALESGLKVAYLMLGNKP